MPLARGLMTINRFNVFDTVTSLNIVPANPPYFCGQTISFTAQVANSVIGEMAPYDGYIEIFDNNSQIILAGGILPSNGIFPGTITLGGGSFSLVANYLGTNGSNVFNPSSSPIISISTPAITTSASITSLPATANCLTTNIPISIYVHATSIGATDPSVGTVSIYGAQPGNIVLLESGIPILSGDGYASIPIGNFPVSAYASWEIQAIYSGQDCYSSSQSPGGNTNIIQFVSDITTTVIYTVSAPALCDSNPLTVVVSVASTLLPPPSSGTVILTGYNGSDVLALGSASPIDGYATINVPSGTFTPVGIWNMQAQYLSDVTLCYAPSHSPIGSSVVVYDYTNNPSTISLVVPSSGSTSFTDQSVAVTAEVGSDYADVTSGTVSFYGGYDYANLSLVASANVGIGGTASTSIQAGYFTTPGTYYLQAVYGGTQCSGSSFTPSGSSALSITIIQAGTTTNITSAIPQAVYCNNTNIGVTVQVNSAIYSPPSVGTVTLYAFQGSDYLHGTSFVLGTATPTNGVANMTIVISNFAQQAYNQQYYIQAVYSGSGVYPASNSVGNPGAPPMRILLDNTSTSITSVSSSQFCQSSSVSVSVSVSATELSAPSTGTVTLYAVNAGGSQVTLGSSTPNNGSATISFAGSAFPSIGGWYLVATYSSGLICYNNSNSPSGSSGYLVTVYNYTNNGTATILTSPSASSTFFVGSSVHVIAYVSSTYGTPGGAVSFYGSYNPNSSFQLLVSANIGGSGTASADIPASYLSSAGEFYIQAVYGGSQCFGSSSTPSGTNALPIYMIQAGTNTVITSNIPAAVYCNNTNIGVTVQVTSSEYSPPSVGTITLYAVQGDTSEVLGTATPSSGIANMTIVISNFSAFANINMPWQIQAAYTGGGIQYPNSTSASQQLEILGDTTNTTITPLSSANICHSSGLVEMTVNVSATELSAPSIGTVTLYAVSGGGSQVTLGTATPSNGTATVSFQGNAMTLGVWFLEATYTSNGVCYSGSASPSGTSGYAVTIYDHTTNTTSTSLQFPSTTPVGNSVTITAQVSSVYGIVAGTNVQFFGGYNFVANSLGTATINYITPETGYASVTIPGSTLNQHNEPFYLEAYINGTICMAASTTGFGTSGPIMTTT